MKNNPWTTCMENPEPITEESLKNAIKLLENTTRFRYIDPHIEFGYQRELNENGICRCPICKPNKILTFITS